MLWCETVRLKGKLSITLLSLLVFLIIAYSILDSAMGYNDKLVVQNVDISPRIAKIGESVRVKANMRNAGKSTKNCDIKALVCESVVEEFKGIIISPGETVSLLFAVNTSSLNEGSNPVDIIVEDESSQPTIFDLGTIQVQQEDVQRGGGDPVISGGFNMLYLLAIFPLGATVAFFVWKRRSSKNQEDKMSKDLLPNLLNEVLNFEENMEAGAGKTKNSSSDTSYVR